MPLYGYACDACGHRFDHLQRLSEADPTVCPSCAGIGVLRRELSAPQFRLKGAGWYETDFKGASDKKRNLAEAGEPKSDKPAESTAASDAPPAAQAAPAPAKASPPAPPAAP